MNLKKKKKAQGMFEAICQGLLYDFLEARSRCNSIMTAEFSSRTGTIIGTQVCMVKS